MGTSDTPLSYMTISEMLHDQAKAFPNNDFNIFSAEGIRWKYKEFNDMVDTIAKGFMALGLEKGDRVGMYGPNRHEWMLTMYACHRADLILVNVNPAF